MTHPTQVLDEVREQERSNVTANPSRLYAFLRILSTAGAVLLSQPKSDSKIH